KLTAFTDYNSHGYFLYRGTTMGFQYELLNSFTDYLGIELELITENEFEDALTHINDKEYDVLAMDLAITSDRKKNMLFCDPIYKSKQILVQKLPDNWRKMRTWDEIESHLLRDAINLQGKKVYIQKGSSFIQRLHNINNETGGEMEIIEVDKSIDELITEVAKGDITYTVCDSHVAKINKKYHKNIDIETQLGSYSQNLAWAFPLGYDSLVIACNKWLKDYKRSKEFYYVYNKYFKNSRTIMMANSEYNSYNGNKLSPFDEIIKEYSEIVNWDWKLLASLIYQESKFDPHAESWAGAFGLMQMMPETAKEFHLTESSTADKQIKAGVKYLQSIDRQLKKHIPDSIERRKFVMASYNVGMAHVLDARRLAEKYDKNPEIWENNVDFYLLNKSKPKYYKDPVVYYGYCRGSEPYKYVNQIYKRFDNYNNLIKDE
ncbi:MAG: transporter substrate-binding domain-containing protein, partial [Bacteroidales bacterium]|nr:transporter substrate-binding domain-containing protein [Bacteroidales bacterium]